MPNKDKTIAVNAETLNKMSNGTLQELIGVLQEQVGNIKLDKEAREELKEKLGVDDKTANGWNTAGDVLKMVDTFEMLADHPDVAKKVVDTVLGLLGTIFPVALIGKTLLAYVPEGVYAKLMRVLAFTDPVHLAHKATGAAGAKSLQNAVELSQYAESLLSIPEGYDCSLVIVAKDDLIAQAMAQLIERNDDTEEGVVGTKDGSVYAIVADEKFYQKVLAGRVAGQKKLFIGNLKSSENLRRSSVKKFEQYGVTYGWAGTDAYIACDTKKLDKKADYEAFLKEIEEVDFDKLDKGNARFKMSIANAAKIAFATPILIKDAYDYQVKVTRQQLTLQAQLAGCENRIQTERERFNEAAKTYNQSIRKFPSSLIAKLFGFERRPYFEAEAGAERVPETF